MSLKVELENIGGYMHTKVFPNIEKGINRVRAPNAIGKTSFTKALELLILSDEELRGKGHYTNLFVGSEENFGITLTGDINHERRFRRVGEDLKESGTSPLIGYNGNRILNVCFAIPDNRLMRDLLDGKEIKSYIELLAGSENYEKAQAALHEIGNSISIKIQHYRDMLIRLEEYKKQKEEDRIELETLRQKFAEAPYLDEKEIFEDFGRYNRKKQELDNVNEGIAKIRANLQDLEEAIESARDNIRKYESQIQLIKTRHPRIDARLNEIADKLPTIKRDLEKFKIQKSKAEEKLSSAQRNDVFLRKYGDEGFCYACGKRMTRAELHSWMSKIKSEIADLNSMERSLKREIEDIESEQRGLKEEKQDLAISEEELKKNQKSLVNREDDKKKALQALEDVENKQKIIMKEIQELSKSEEAYKKFKERQEMKVAIDQKEANIKRAEERIEEFKKQTLGVENLQDKYDFVQFVKNHLEIRKNQIVEEIRGTFNRQVIELYKRLGFRDFDNIEIGPDFRISVTRKKGGKTIENFPLEALSTSERITIAIAFLLAAKNEYVREFPFFVLDELITSYDPKRFGIVKDYLKRSEDYVIITELATDISDVEIIHET